LGAHATGTQTEEHKRPNPRQSELVSHLAISPHRKPLVFAATSWNGVRGAFRQLALSGSNVRDCSRHRKQNVSKCRDNCLGQVWIVPIQQRLPDLSDALVHCVATGFASMDSSLLNR
jgi:hypothetical protein